MPGISESSEPPQFDRCAIGQDVIKSSAQWSNQGKLLPSDLVLCIAPDATKPSPEGGPSCEMLNPAAYATTSIPIERAVPLMLFTAASTVAAFRSGIFCVAISRTCASVTLPGAPGLDSESANLRRICSPQAGVNWLNISGRLTYRGVPLTSRRAASTQSVPEHIRPVRVVGSMIQTVSTPILR